MSGQRTPLGRSTTVLWRGPSLSNHATETAESAMQSQEVRLRLSQEEVQTAADLLELDKEDLKDLGLNMVERRRVLRWAFSPSPIDFLESLQNTNGVQSAEGRPLQAVEKAISDLDMWFALADATSFPVNIRQLKESFKDDAHRFRHSEGDAGRPPMADYDVKDFSMHARSIRENMLDEHFDLTSERIQEIFLRVSNDREICTPEELLEGLSKIGITCRDVTCLAAPFRLVMGQSSERGLQPMELDVILSRLKLAQLLGRGEGSVSGSVPPGRFTLVDYNMHKAAVQDLTGERLLRYFFGHRAQSEPSDNIHRWIHMRGCHLILLMALMVKYRLSPLGVEDIIEQGPTKVGEHGNNIFVTLDWLQVDSSAWRQEGCDGSSPVQISCSYLTLIISAPHRADTLISVVQPNRLFEQDWPGAENSKTAFNDAWSETLMDRLKRLSSRLAEHDVRYLAQHVVQLCVDDLLSVVRAFAARLDRLEEDLNPNPSTASVGSSVWAAGSRLPPATWLAEVSLIRLQLAVVCRRLRNHRLMLRRLMERVAEAGVDRRLAGYLRDIADDVEVSLEDSGHLIDRCGALASSYDTIVNREADAQRRQSKDALMREQEEQNRHAERLNDTLFVLTFATTLFAPVQFLAGVYGMNFAVDGDPTIPELKWEYGYLYFWILVIVYLIGSSVLAAGVFRRLRIQQKSALLPRTRYSSSWTDEDGSRPHLHGRPFAAREDFTDPSRRPRTLVLHHRGRLDADHAKNWTAGRTSELTKTVSRSCAFPQYNGAMTRKADGIAGADWPVPVGVIADTARKLLLERVSCPFPCSRLALGATDFIKVENQGPRITAFFADKPGARCEAPETFPEQSPLPTESESENEGYDLEGDDVPKMEAPPKMEALPETAPAAKDVLQASVAEFHRASRLHFLGTWRERFERWRAACGAGPEVLEQAVPLRQEVESFRQDDAQSVWAHLDMDCFFVSVATRDMAKSAGAATDEVPTAVVSGLGASSEICSANYAARRAGVNTHLWSVERARAVLPTLRLVPISSELLRSVEETWKKVYQLLVVACGDEPDHVFMRSCDEAALLVKAIPDPVAWAEALRSSVRLQTGCTCSVGIGPTQLVAKLATKACKPNGVRRILQEEVKPFLADLPLRDMPQVGHAMSAKLQERGLESCRDIQSLEQGRLREWFGAKGETLWLNAQGLDQEVSPAPAQRKSVSAEMNWGIRCQDRSAAVKILTEVSQQLSERLLASDLRAIHLTLKLKIAVPGWVEPIKRGGHGQCDDVSRSAPLPDASNEPSVLLRTAQHLFDTLSPDPVRLRGVGLAAKLGTVSSSSRSPQKAAAGTSSLTRWLKRGPAEAPQPSTTSTTQAADSTIVVDLEASEQEPHVDDCVECPVCSKLISRAEADAHVNRHFEDISVEPPAKRLCPAVPAGDDSECELLG
ncbi:REV1 [Symbiodinium natans]|uniref:REV1 protein n=1 Tax=Symbiodinium natans TaxID=878477 RepID=A0A812SJJ5_9DINO|nr:REV1 [Symbiodinium natans]